MLCTKKPIQVEMICWTGSNLEAVVRWGEHQVDMGRANFVPNPRIGGDGHLRLYVVKGESECTLAPGDWIALESDGSGYYPVARDIFEKTYETPEET